MNASSNEMEYYDDTDYEDFIFWNNIMQTIIPIFEHQSHLDFLVAVIGVLVNIFHLIVLSRKSMRLYTINLFLIGIAICDFLRLIFNVLVALSNYYHKYQTSIMPEDCTPPKSWLSFFVSVHSITIPRIFQKLAVCFGVAMAVLRVIILKYPLNRRGQNLKRSSSGICILLIVCIPHIPFWFFDLQWTEIQENGIWKPPPGCENFNDHNLHIEYSVKPGEYSSETLLRIEGVLFTVIPSLILPIVTGTLIYFFKTLKKSTSSRNNDHNARSTIMVTLVAVTFVIATFPLLLTYLVDFLSLGYRLAFFIILFGAFCEFVSLINGTLHFLLCAFISTQYQKTVREMFGRKISRITVATI
ncbi:G-protein coupled receptors family 1 profile domain-containing protein [Caenorhabditis elegans]|uniref:G-protein coupled receptors family 1 profile domain-containing protein n=1 Tax=Caenorhabditis elegans TaxID=6239 RepID=O45472_CAEEL|nr:G-protein coupled receptors family 1 profile domain-containing protein [Caenorhabditis elegans]CAB04333.2 G-protein coupled receptors family 1 profile domain-containing protein [Caenorhabditis elegans]|eukprot:NP_506997.2 Serpentine Receptor, class W [Caenorhabditis elegans]